MNRRTKKILKLKEQKYTLEEISNMVSPVLTPERIRQIINKANEDSLSFCIKHKIAFKKSCPICNLEKTYYLSIKNLSFEELSDEIERLSKYDRTKETVLQRDILIRRLRDDFGFSFNKIGKILQRDHTTILWIYHSKKNI